MEMVERNPNVVTIINQVEIIYCRFCDNFLLCHQKKGDLSSGSVVKWLEYCPYTKRLQLILVRAHTVVVGLIPDGASMGHK